MSQALEILFEDADLIAVEKPRGVLVESFEGGEESLADRVVANVDSRARPLHRLDRETTGVVLFAKNARWNRELAGLFENKRIRKEYWAIVRGNWDKRIGRIDTNIAPIGEGRWQNSKSEGKPASTTFRLLKQAEGQAWVQALPKTGRTHQIRLHCLEAGCPIVGEAMYAQDGNAPLLLHARSLSFVHPGDREKIEVTSEAPADWEKWLKRFDG